MTEDEIIAAVRAELRPGGHPTQTYLSLQAQEHISHDAAIALTNAIALNVEDRLAQLEHTDG